MDVGYKLDNLYLKGFPLEKQNVFKTNLLMPNGPNAHIFLNSFKNKTRSKFIILIFNIYYHCSQISITELKWCTNHWLVNNNVDT